MSLAQRALSVVLITASYPGAQAGSNLPLSPPPPSALPFPSPLPHPTIPSPLPPSISFLPSYFFSPFHPSAPFRYSPHHRHFLLAYFFPRKLLAHLWAKQNNWGTIALTYRSSWFRQWNEKRSREKGRSCGSFSNYLETTGLIRRIVAFFKSVILFIVIERDKWGERGKGERFQKRAVF